MKKSFLTRVLFLSLLLACMNLWGSSGNSGIVGKLNLNTAGADELVLLPGIGKKKAQEIISLRDRIKGFKYTDDILKVKGLGKKLYKQILPFIKLEGQSDLKKTVMINSN